MSKYVITSQDEAYTPTGDWTDVPGSKLRTEEIACALYRVTLAGAACDIRVVQAQFTETAEGKRELGPYQVDQVFLASELTTGTWPILAVTQGHRVKVQARAAGGSPTVFVRGRGFPLNISAAVMERLEALLDPREDTDTLSRLATLIPLLDAGAAIDGDSEVTDVDTAIASATASLAALNVLGAILDAAFDEEDIAAAVTAAAALIAQVKVDLDAAVATMLAGAPADIATQAAALAAVPALAAKLGSVVCGPPSSNVAPLAFDVVSFPDDAELTGEGPFTFLVVLQDTADDSIVATTAFSLAASTGSAALLDDGSTAAVYALETTANGELVTAITDEAGSSGRTIRPVVSLVDGNGRLIAIDPAQFPAIEF